MESSSKLKMAVAPKCTHGKPYKPHSTNIKICVRQQRRRLFTRARRDPKMESSSTACPPCATAGLVKHALCMQCYPCFAVGGHAQCCQVIAQHSWQLCACPAGWSAGAAGSKRRWGVALHPCPCCNNQTRILPSGCTALQCNLCQHRLHSCTAAVFALMCSRAGQQQWP